MKIKIEQPNSYLTYELKDGNILILDLYVDVLHRNKGAGTSLLKEVMDAYPNGCFYSAAVSKGMISILEKLSFEKVCDKHFKNAIIALSDIPIEVRYSNAVIYRIING